MMTYLQHFVGVRILYGYNVLKIEYDNSKDESDIFPKWQV